MQIRYWILFSVTVLPNFVIAGILPCAISISGYIPKTGYNRANCNLHCAAEMATIVEAKRCQCIDACLTRCQGEYDNATNNLNSCNLNNAPVQPLMQLDDIRTDVNAY